jgi:uncharacterized membrane protein (DUF485 family)
MIESEINLIADKLGMTITQIYQMNVQYQEFVAFRNAISVLIAVVVFLIWVIIISYVVKKDESLDSKLESVIIIGYVYGFCMAFVLFFIVSLCIDGIVLPMKYPEYAAMVQTMDQIRSFTPCGGN